MSELSIEMKEFAFQAAVQAAAKRASESSGSPEEVAVSVAAAALKAAAGLGLQAIPHPLGSLATSTHVGAE